MSNITLNTLYTLNTDLFEECKFTLNGKPMYYDEEEEGYYTLGGKTYSVSEMLHLTVSSFHSSYNRITVCLVN